VNLPLSRVVTWAGHDRIQGIEEVLEMLPIRAIVRNHRVEAELPGLADGTEVVIRPVSSEEGNGDSPSDCVSSERSEALRNLIGIWKTETPPTDEQLEQLLADHRLTSGSRP
jgi:hypothetical protein